MHRTTDPACFRHREPSGRLGRWWFDHNRGRVCDPCMLARQAERERLRLTREWLAAKTNLIGEAVFAEIKRHPAPESNPLLAGRIGWLSGASPHDVGRAVVDVLSHEL